jgi:endonuclease III-like uncharacterized protein
MSKPAPDDVVFVGRGCKAERPLKEYQCFTMNMARRYYQAGGIDPVTTVVTKIVPKIWKKLQSTNTVIRQKEAKLIPDDCHSSMSTVKMEEQETQLPPDHSEEVKFWEFLGFDLNGNKEYRELNEAEVAAKMREWVSKKKRTTQLKAVRREAKSSLNNTTVLESIMFAVIDTERDMLADEVGKENVSNVKVEMGMEDTGVDVQDDDKACLYDKVAEEYKIWNGGELLFFEDTKKWWDDRRAERVVKEKLIDRKTSKRKVEQKVKKASSGKRMKVSKSEIAKLSPVETERSNDTEWVAEQVELVESTRSIVKEVERMTGRHAPREDWTSKADNKEQVFLGAILTIRCDDNKLFDTMMAMRKFGIFSIKALAEFDVGKLQDLFLYVGYNLWTEAAARIIGAAKMIVTEFDGKLPSDSIDLLSFNGVGRKVMMIILVCVDCVLCRLKHLFHDTNACH